MDPEYGLIRWKQEAVDRAVRTDTRTGTQTSSRVDHRMWADLDVWVELRSGLHDGTGMDAHASRSTQEGQTSSPNRSVSFMFSL